VNAALHCHDHYGSGRLEGDLVLAARPAGEGAVEEVFCG
jgi:hypothetical protein